MYTIKSNIAVTGTHWGLAFKAGVATTDNAALAKKLKAKGYVVTDEAQPKEIPKEPEEYPVKAKKRAVKDRVSDRS